MSPWDRSASIHAANVNVRAGATRREKSSLCRQNRTTCGGRPICCKRNNGEAIVHRKDTDAYREVYGDMHVEPAQVLARQERGDLFPGRNLHLALDSQNRQRLFSSHNHGVEGDGEGL